MYSEKVKTLTLDKANIIFGITLRGRMDIEISLNYLVYDWFYKLGNSSVYGPDYGCSGYFMQENKFNRVKFIINDNGTDRLFVTGFKKNISNEEKEKIRFENTKFISYFEDTEYGYLFQII